MRRLIPALVLAILVAATVSFAAPKTYQFTGTVKAADASTFTVEKSAAETWTFSTDSATTGAPKVGDKVTVTYKMVATTIVKK
jgi:peptidoglycan/LPS O-acetylase OafA/YrhL